MKTLIARWRQRLLAWAWENLSAVPLHTPNVVITAEDQEKFGQFMGTASGQRIEAALLASVNYECRQAVYAGEKWNCGFAQGYQVCFGKLLKIKPVQRKPAEPAQQAPITSANVPQQTDETSKANGNRPRRALSSTWG